MKNEGRLHIVRGTYGAPDPETIAPRAHALAHRVLPSDQYTPAPEKGARHGQWTAARAHRCAAAHWLASDKNTPAPDESMTRPAGSHPRQSPQTQTLAAHRRWRCQSFDAAGPTERLADTPAITTRQHGRCGARMDLATLLTGSDNQAGCARSPPIPPQNRAASRVGYSP